MLNSHAGTKGCTGKYFCLLKYDNETSLVEMLLGYKNAVTLYFVPGFRFHYEETLKGIIHH